MKKILVLVGLTLLQNNYPMQKPHTKKRTHVQITTSNTRQQPLRIVCYSQIPKTWRPYLNNCVMFPYVEIVSLALQCEEIKNNYKNYFKQREIDDQIAEDNVKAKDETRRKEALELNALQVLANKFKDGCSIASSIPSSASLTTQEQPLPLQTRVLGASLEEMLKKTAPENHDLYKTLYCDEESFDIDAAQKKRRALPKEERLKATEQEKNELLRHTDERYFNAFLHMIAPYRPQPKPFLKK